MLNFKVAKSLYTYQWICLPEYWIVVIVRWHIQSIPIRIICTVVFGHDELNDRSLFTFAVPLFGMLGCHMPKWMFLYPCLDDHLDCLVTGVLWGVCGSDAPAKKKTKSPEMKEFLVRKQDCKTSVVLRHLGMIDMIHNMASVSAGVFFSNPKLKARPKKSRPFGSRALALGGSHFAQNDYIPSSKVPSFGSCESEIFWSIFTVYWFMTLERGKSWWFESKKGIMLPLFLGIMKRPNQPLYCRIGFSFFFPWLTWQVDKDIDLLVIANSASEWWATIVALEERLRNNGCLVSEHLTFQRVSLIFFLSK